MNCSITYHIHHTYPEISISVYDCVFTLYITCLLILDLSMMMFICLYFILYIQYVADLKLHTYTHIPVLLLADIIAINKCFVSLISSFQNRSYFEN